MSSSNINAIHVTDLYFCEEFQKYHELRNDCGSLSMQADDVVEKTNSSTETSNSKNWLESGEQKTSPGPSSNSIKPSSWSMESRKKSTLCDFDISKIGLLFTDAAHTVIDEIEDIFPLNMMTATPSNLNQET